MRFPLTRQLSAFRFAERNLIPTPRGQGHLTLLHSSAIISASGSRPM
jgi:hypothetical protein